MQRYRKTLPSMSRLIAFAAVAQHGNVTAAADALGLTQAAVSRQLRELEAHIGQALARRHPQGVTLTGAGKRLIADLPAALDRICDAIDDISPQGDESEITVFCDHSLTTAFLIPRVVAFERTHPGKSVRVLASNRPMESVSGAFDLAVQHGLQRSDGYESRLIARDRIFPVAAPAIADNWEASDDIASLAALPLLELADRGAGWLTWEGFFRRFGGTLGVAPRAVFDSYAAAIEAARLGQGILLGWQLSLGNHLESGALRPLGDWTVEAPEGLRVYHPKSKPLKAGTRMLIAWLSAS